MQISQIASGSNRFAVASMPEGGGVDEVMKQAFSKLMIESYEDKSDVLKSVNNPVNNTDPEKLFEYQKRIQEYNINISMISTLTRKAFNTVETLLRS